MNDFEWQTAQKFVEVICFGLTTADIEHYEAIADSSFVDGDDND